MKFLLTVLIVCFAQLSCQLFAQEIVPIKLSVENEIPGASFSKTTFGLEFWVQESVNFVALDTLRTKVSVLKDNLGNDLLKAHEKEVSDYEMHVRERAEKGRYMFSSRGKKIVDFANSKALQDTSGFKLVFDSWALPRPKATKVYLRAAVAYFISGNKAETQIIENLTFQNIKTMPWLGKQIPVRESGSGRMGDYNYIAYQLQTTDLGVRVKKVEQVEANGKVIKVLSQREASDQITFEIGTKDLSTPISLKITYASLQQRMLRLDEEITLGL